MHLANALEFSELGKHQGERLLHSPVRILLDPITTHLDVADCHREEELTALGLELQGLERTLAQQRQLHLAHGALHPEQEPIIDQTRVIDPVLIKQQAADQSAELKQGVPVTAVAGEPGGFYREHSTNPAFANGG
jgi:hypothetical protein